MKIKHISVSRADTYQECDARYKYRYHLEVLPEYTPFHFTFGKIAHKIIEEHTRGRGAKTVGEAARAVLDGKVEIEPGVTAPPLQAADANRLGLHLTNYAKLAAQVGCDGEVEWPFDIDLDPPNGRRWVGFIDRIIVKGGKAFVLDWKTTKPGKWRKDRVSIRKDLQIMGYCYVARKAFNLPADKVRAALFYLEDGTLVDSGHFTDAALDAVPQNLLTLFKKIEAQSPEAVVGNPGERCNRCDYQKICPFYKEYRTGRPLGGGR